MKAILKPLIVSKPGDLDDVMQRVMQTPIKMPYYLKRAQEKQLITQAEKNTKVIEQLVTLNRIYTTDSFARVTRNIEAPTLILWGKQDKIINVEVANELKIHLETKSKGQSIRLSFVIFFRQPCGRKHKS
jgi:esterase/lipase